MKAPGGSREVVGVTRVPGPDPGGGTGCPGDEERTERGDEERTEERKTQEVRSRKETWRGTILLNFSGGKYALCVWEKGTHRGHTCPRKSSPKLCSTREGVSFGPSQRGWAIAFNPSQRGAGGSTIQGVQGGKATRHHTTPHPFQTAPDRTTTHLSPTHRHSTRHLTTPGAPEHHTRHYPKTYTNRSPPTRKTPSFPRTLHPFGTRAPLYSTRTPSNHHPRTLHPFGTRAPLYSKMTT